MFFIKLWLRIFLREKAQERIDEIDKLAEEAKTDFWKFLSQRQPELFKSHIPTLLQAGALFGLLWLIWRGGMPVDIGKLFTSGISWSGIGHVWFLFAWAGISILKDVAILVHKRKLPTSTVHARRRLNLGLRTSLMAGVFEEIEYRGLYFLNLMPILVFLNFITFGFVKWMFVQGLEPFTNMVTFHTLQPALLNQHWQIGAALIVANAYFALVHLPNGKSGYSTLSAWVIGMIMFWLALNYGLLTAIVVHVVYDLVLFTAMAVLTKYKPGPMETLARALLRGALRQIRENPNRHQPFEF